MEIKGSLYAGPNSSVTGTTSVAFGDNVKAYGDYSRAEGKSTTALGNYSTASGYYSSALGIYSHAEGSSTASGDYSHSEGQITTASGYYSHAEGYSTEALGNGSHAEGANTTALGVSSHAEGTNTLSLGDWSHAEGTLSTSQGIYSHAEGGRTTASGDYSHAEGYATIAQGNYQHVSGQYNLTASTQGAFIVGNGTGNLNRSNLLFAGGNEVNISGKTITTDLQVTNGATNGYVLTSDVSGNATWQPPATPANDFYLTGLTFNQSNFDLTALVNNGSAYTVSLSILATDMTVTGGTYNPNTGVATFVTNSGNTFDISGFLTGYTDVFLTGATYDSGTGILTLTNTNGSVVQTSGFTTGGGSSQSVTGFTYSNNNLTIQRGGTSDLVTNISTMTGLTINGSFTVNGNSVMSGTSQNVLTIIGSGSTQPLFTIQGSSGELFSVTDNLVGSLFSVNNISGLPVLEIFDTDAILMGNYLAPSLNTTVRLFPSVGLNTLYSIPISAYTGAWFEYTVKNNSGARAGQIMSIFSGTSVNTTESTTTSIGSTTPITFNMISDGLNASLRVSATTSGWEVKTIVRSI
jgi:hypothetical protein